METKQKHRAEANQDNNPVVIRRGRAVILKETKILLCQRIGTDYWYLPGGKAESEESTGAALIREILEELGLRGTLGIFVGVFEYFFFDARRQRQTDEMNILFTVGFRSKVPKVVKSKEAHLRFEWVECDELHTKNILPKELMQYLSVWLKKLQPFYGTATCYTK